MRLMIAGSMIILMGMFCISCGGTNKASRTVSTSDSGYNQVYCNQNYWYTVSGCMPPTTWTVPADFVLSNSWYPSVLNYTYPEWYVNAGLKVSFKSTCKDNNSCGKTLAGVEPYIVDPATRDDANTVYQSFRFDRVLSRDPNHSLVQWSSESDPELKASGYNVFNSDGKLDVALKLVGNSHGNQSYQDYTGAEICTNYAYGYSLVGGTLYARRLKQDGTYQSLAESIKVPFLLYLEGEQTYSLIKESQGNANVTAGTYILEIRDLKWNGICLFNNKQSATSNNTYCSSTVDLRALGPSSLKTNDKGIPYYACVELEIAVSWNRYTPNLGE